MGSRHLERPVSGVCMDLAQFDKASQRRGQFAKTRLRLEGIPGFPRHSHSPVGKNCLVPALEPGGPFLWRANNALLSSSSFAVVQAEIAWLRVCSSPSVGTVQCGMTACLASCFPSISCSDGQPLGEKHVSCVNTRVLTANQHRPTLHVRAETNQA